MTKKADEFGVPYPPHERAEWNGPDGGILEKRIAEVRGVRNYRRNIYKDIVITALEAELEPDSPAAIYDALRVMADEVLQESGFLTYGETIETIKKSTAPTGIPNVDAGMLALLLQRETIVSKHGGLSREATASQFIVANDAMGEIFKLLDERQKALLWGWLDAAYWLRFEETGGHGLAYAGLKAMQGRKTSAPSRSKAKARRLQIVSEEFAKLDPAAQLKTDAAALELLQPVHARIVSERMVPYTQKTLKKVISQLGLVAKAKGVVH